MNSQTFSQLVRLGFTLVFAVDGTTFFGFAATSWSAKPLMDDVAREGASAGFTDEGGGGDWRGDRVFHN